MIIIHDKDSSGQYYALSKLIEEIKNIFPEVVSNVQITRLGGAGAGIWEYESKLDAGLEVIIEFKELERLCNSDDDLLDELFVKAGIIRFGIFDSTFLFFQCENKAKEKLIKSKFKKCSISDDF